MKKFDLIPNLEDDEEDFDGLDIKPRAPSGEPYPSAATLLPQLLLKRVLPPDILRKIRMGLPATLVIIVPDNHHATVDAALRELCSDALRVVRCRQKNNDAEQLQGIRGAGAGAPVVYLASNMGQVPAVIRGLSQATYVLPAPDPASVRETIRRCTRGRVPARFAPDLSAVPLPVVAAAIVSGSLSKYAMHALDRLARAEHSTIEDDLPSLKDCIEYGPLRDWGLQLSHDLRDWKRGKLAASDIDASILLVSPPGFGKTFFAKVLQRHLNIPLIRLGISEIMAGDGYLNTAMKHMTTAFETARRSAPSILFLDEVDTFPTRGGTSRNDGYFTALVNHALVLLDGVASENHGVVVIGATNRPEAIDPALLRPGRLARTIIVPLPDAAAREHILRTHLRTDLSGVPIHQVVTRTEGHTPAELMQAVREARTMARTKAVELTINHLLEVVGSAAADLPRVLVERVAIHEAGHAVCAMSLNDPAIAVRSVTVQHAGNAGGHTAFAPERSYLDTLQSLDNRVITLLSGRAAEVIFFGPEKTSGAGGPENSDLAIATRIVAASIASFGMYDTLIWRAEPEHAFKVMHHDPHMRALVENKLQTLMSKALELAESNRRHIQAVAKALLKHQTIDRAMLDKIMRRIGDQQHRAAEQKQQENSYER